MSNLPNSGNIRAMRDSMDLREKLDYVRQPLAFGNDIVALHAALVTLTDDDSARVFGRKLAGMRYDLKCACYLAQVERLYELMPVLDISAHMAIYENDMKHMTPEQVEDEAVMRTDELMSEYGAARREVTHFQKGL
jgi:hypothetical protein